MNPEYDATGQPGAPANDQAGAARKAQALMAQGKPAEAVELLEAFCAASPQDPRAWNDLGVAYAVSGQGPRALEALSRAQNLNGTTVRFAQNYAEVLASMGRWQEAVDYLEQSLARFSGEPGRELAKLLDYCRARAQRATPPETPPPPQAPEPSRVEFNTFKEALANPPATPPGLGRVELPAEDLELVRKARILQGPSEIIGNIHRLTTYLRSLGVQAVGLNYGHNKWAGFRCDVNLNISSLTPQAAQEKITSLFREAVELFDIFHFHYARSFFPNLADLQSLRNLGKKIVFTFYGSDQRSDEVFYYNQAKFLGHNPPKPFYLTRSMLPVHEVINAYADVLFSPTGTPRGIYNPGVMDASHWSLAEKERILAQNRREKDPGKLYILHAPSDSLYKGSQMLMALLEECRRKGMPIEIITVTNTPLPEARKIYALADCAVDQVGAGTFGLFGREMMCWQIPVLCYQNRLFERIRPGAPIINITRENFLGQVSRLVGMKKSGELAGLGERSREWVLETSDVAKVGIPGYVSVYASLLKGEKVKQYINNKWFLEAGAISAGRKSDFYRYMLDNRVFEQIGIKTPSYDPKLYN